MVVLMLANVEDGQEWEGRNKSAFERGKKNIGTVSVAQWKSVLEF